MHVLNISTNVFHRKNRNSRRSINTIMIDIFNDLKRNIVLENRCHVEYSSYYVDHDTKRVHLIIEIDSNDPVILANICDLTEGILHIPKKALEFIH